MPIRNTVRRCVIVCQILLAVSVFDPTLFATTFAESGSNHIYQVGVAKKDVTPDYPVRLSGFAFRKTESEGISQKIWARALAIGADASSNDAGETTSGPVVIVTLDSLGVRLEQVNEIASRLAKKTGLQRDRLAITFTHTHCAPKVNGAADNIFAEAIPPEHQDHLDQYTVELVNAIEGVVLEALASRKPATLEWGVGEVGFAKNRRTPGGPTDHSLPILVVRNVDAAGTVRAIYTSYACHCVTLSHNLISGDWAGYAVEAIERHFPDAMGLVSIGCGSDQNPVSGVTGDKIDVCQMQGMQIGDEISRLIEQRRLTPLGGRVHTTLNHLQLAFQTLPTRDEYEKMVEAGGAPGYNAQTQLQKLNQGKKLPVSLEYPIQTVSFGDELCMVFLSGEVCVDYAIRLRKELAPNRIWMHGYSNDFGAYIPSERLLAEGGYGAGAEIPYFALPAKLMTGLEEQIVAEVHRQVPPAFRQNLAGGTNGISPRSPEESLRALKTHPTLKVELVACEPQISDPVAIDFGLNGDVWVCQMVDYGHGIEEEFTPRGQVRVLKDLNADGLFESSTVFLDGLRYPTDVKIWRDGALVCDAPDILYAEDTNGDGVADLRKVLFTGFATHNGQARVNSLQWGLDGWVYGSCGLFGGRITNESGVVVDVTGRDFRIRPDTGEMEPVTGRTQQSRVRDDWGNWFGCDNGTLIRHYPVSEDYARRNPFVPPSPTAVFVPTGQDAGRLFPSSDLVLFKLSGAAGRATAACGVGVYRDDLLGESYSGNSFSCEPVNQLVYRQQLFRQGATIRGRRAPNEQSVDFLTSTDQWFRPVQARTGPDGAIWVVDMYRYVIEHPKWIPEETLAELNVFAGQGLGRIYRVTTAGAGRQSVGDLRAKSNPELVELVNHPNGTVRDMVHQSLIWREAADVTDALNHVATAGSRPASRLQALSILDGLDQLSQDVLLVALQDKHPEVRRNAIRLSEALLANSGAETGKTGVLLEQVLAMKDDPAFEVRQQLALSLGNVRSARAPAVLAELAQSSSDPFMSGAVLSSLNTTNIAPFTEIVLQNPGLRSRLGDDVLASVAGMGNEDAVRDVLSVLLTSEDNANGLRWHSWQLQSLARLLDGLDRRKPAPVGCVTPELEAAAGNLASDIRKALMNSETSDEALSAMLGLPGRRLGPVSSKLFQPGDLPDSAEIVSFVSPQFSSDRQLSAVRAMTNRAEEDGGALLLSRISAATPAVRQEIVKALLSQRNWDSATVTALEDGNLTAFDLDAAAREQLTARLSGDLKKRASKVLESTHSDRQALVAEWSDVATMTGDLSAGRAAFAKRCSVCHRLENVGHVVGPDLAALTARSTSFLLNAILDPNRDVDARYQSYVVVNDQGQSFSGLMVSETSTSITLRQQEGKEIVFLRNELEEIKATGKSVMPEGLEKDLTRQELADILAYLQELGPEPKSFEGNHPSLVKAIENGQLNLLASTGSIYGDEIAYETNSPFRNIGYWHSAEDRVVWGLLVTESGDFDVWMDYSCDDATAGNHLRIDGGEPTLTTVVAGTGGWASYRQKLIGRIHLSSGRNQLSLKAAAALRGTALLDLRSLILVPAGATPLLAMDSTSENKDFGTVSPVMIARTILDDTISGADREKVIADNSQHSAAVIRAMTEDLPEDPTEEYRRIPWIWRVAIAAGRRNQSGEILAILDASLPQQNQPLRDWQAVVIGGGIINGISLEGGWPLDRIQRLIAGNTNLSIRWNLAIQQAGIMADNDAVRKGTRYDALRMIALQTWDEAGEQLVKYLGRDVDAELQQGAVSGLSDMPAAEAGRQLLIHLPHLTARNKEFALDALMRTTARIHRLLTAVENGDVNASDLGTHRIERLREHQELEVRDKANHLLP
ncbi:MAG: neutral/alkaline non-lysosomal ceramidase N-terminal domain-containing protein [Planctomycetaceae bacterium]|nr:neutral/alkaline non-lysosomal ceramidase N-terminal domain-containing protein [Planctomycetaceae bacterium]